MNNLFWNNSSASGLCDRLLDICLMSTFAKMNKSYLYFFWQSVNNGGQYSWDDGEKKVVWDDVRYEDYKLENFLKFFNLPKNLIINQYPDVYDVFSNYLGGVYSPFSFYETFLSENFELSSFIKEFYNTLSEITPTNYLLDLTKDIELPELSVHLRRKDKIRKIEDEHSLNFEKIYELNNLTIQSIDGFIKTNHNLKIYFCSDDFEEKEKFNKKYKNNIINFHHKSNLVEDTYVDMYLLSKSNNIILSQKHSNFSIFCSLLNNTNLIYFYEDSPIEKFGFNKLNNFKKFIGE